MEGVFYCPKTDEGQLSLSYMCERRDDQSYREFRATCVRLALEIEVEAAAKLMSAYFEIGVAHQQS